MQTTQWRPPIPLIGRLLQRPQQFEFFQAVRVLEAWTGMKQDLSVGKPHGKIRFHNRVSMSFPSSDIESIKLYDMSPGWSSTGIEVPPDEAWVGVTPSFMGLLGSTGTLPFGFTDAIMSAKLAEGTALREFFDIFSQRSFTLFCTAWARARITYRFDQNGRNKLLPSQLSISGTRSEPRKDDVCDEIRAFYGGLLRKRCVSAKVLGQVLSDYLSATITVQPCVAEWSELAHHEKTMLGLTHCTLGTDSAIGPRVYQRDKRVRVRIGPLANARYREFEPRSKGVNALMRMLACFPVTHLQFELNVALRAEDIRRCILQGASMDDPTACTRLGLNMFLGEPQGRAREDLRFDLSSLRLSENERSEIGA